MTTVIAWVLKTRQRTAAELDRARLAIARQTEIGSTKSRRSFAVLRGGDLKDSGKWLTVQDDVDEFTRPMLVKLGENMHKCDYRDQSLLELFDALVVEIDELEDELCSDSTTALRIVHEAADVANFAMMIATVATDGWAPGWHLPDPPGDGDGDAA